MAISILYVRALVERVVDTGVPRATFLDAAGFDAQRLDESDARITCEEYAALQASAFELTGDEALGLHMGEAASATTYSLAAHLVAHATTMRHGLNALLRFHRLLTDSPSWQLVENDRTATLRYELGSGSARCKRFNAELTMTGFFRMVRHFSRHARPECVCFEHAAPAYRAEYARIFEGVERFEQPFTGIIIDRALLDAVQLHQDLEFHVALEAQAEKRVSRLTRSRKYSERVREYLVESATPERRDMKAAARALGLSPRSLRRRLSQEGSSYTALVEQSLATRAKRLLADGECSIEAAAYAMGFADPSAFYRAFKRWTGTTPKEYRSRGRSQQVELRGR
jgi:AraC-like DNA-binding protein